MKHKKLRALCEGAIMVALATALSYLKLLELPQGGSVCIGMLPIFLYSARWGVGPAFLTLACGKYRFNDLDLGSIGGIPRLLDIGQCNDAYSAIQIALTLADAFGCTVNELPLSMVLSWYEQKAVCILLTLLHLGIQGIRLGPTLPAFLSPNVLNYLAEHYAIAPTSTPEADLADLLA